MQYNDYTNPDFRKAFFAFVEASEHVVITAHMSPDDDSIASVLSVYTMLSMLYPEKHVRIVYTGIPSERHAIFPNFEKIEFVDDLSLHVDGADMLIILDVNRFVRVTSTPDALRALNIKRTVAIDHHGTEPEHFSLSMVVPTCTSNAELIYRSLNAESMLNKELAELFLLGILGDTGNFAYVPPEQMDVLVIAKKLIEMVGMPIDAFRSRYGGIPKRIVPLLQMLVHHMHYESIPGWPDVQVTHVDRNSMIDGNYTDEDMSAASHIYMGQYVPKIQGYGWGLVATPRADGSIRVSGRSIKGSVNVRELFERMNIGGGHDRASGALIKKEGASMDGKEGLDMVLSWMKEHKPL
jgi:nanoRNase/pAp phosphatase (c-di-AMP/oligoRNAs hydrolase)